MTSDSVVRVDAGWEVVRALDAVFSMETYLALWDTLAVDSAGASLPRVLMVRRVKHEAHRGDSVSSDVHEEVTAGSSEAIGVTEAVKTQETKSGRRGWSWLVYVAGMLSAVAAGWLAYKTGVISRIGTWLRKSF